MTTRRGFGAMVVVALAATLALAGCSDGPAPEPRTHPNAFETTAVAAADLRAGIAYTGTVNHWVQLWTPNQVAGAVERCVSTTSHGVLIAQVSPPAAPWAVDYVFGDVGDGLDPLTAHFTAPDVATRLINTCTATSPVDTRRGLVPKRDREELYSYDVTLLRRCLVEHGFRVAAVPPRARYLLLMNAGVPWSPYDSVKVASRNAWFALSDACPALPDTILDDLPQFTG